jgi:hypothetical protein
LTLQRYPEKAHVVKKNYNEIANLLPLGMIFSFIFAIHNITRVRNIKDLQIVLKLDKILIHFTGSWQGTRKTDELFFDIVWRIEAPAVECLVRKSTFNQFNICSSFFNFANGESAIFNR